MAAGTRVLRRVFASCVKYAVKRLEYKLHGALVFIPKASGDTYKAVAHADAWFWNNDTHEHIMVGSYTTLKTIKVASDSSAKVTIDNLNETHFNSRKIESPVNQRGHGSIA